MHDPCGVQICQRPEQRGHGGHRLAGSELTPGREQLGQAATVDVVQDQGEAPVCCGNGAVSPDQVLAADPVIPGHLLTRQGQRLRQVEHRQDLEREGAPVQAADRRPLGAVAVGPHVTCDETWHERLQCDDSPYCLGMATDAPTILATSGGYRDHARLRFQFGDLLHYAVDLSGACAVVPRVCNVSTASGDDPRFQMEVSEAGRVAGFNLTHLSLFSMPNLEDIEGHLMEQDVVWVNGGSVANLLAVWRVHGLDEILRRVWQAGVVLAGVSAGSICWFEGGTTDSFGPELRAITDGLGFLPYGNGVHYDSEDRRRPLIHQLVANGTLGTTHCTDDGVGILYRGTELVEAVTDQPGRSAYVVSRDGDRAVEERLETRLLSRS